MIVFHRFMMGLYLCGSMGLFAVWLVPASAITSNSGSSVPFMAVWAFMYAYTVFILLNLKSNLTRNELLILILSIFLIVTSLWSITPQKTFIYSISFFMNVLAVFAIRRLFSLSQFLDMVVYVLCLMIITSLIFYVLGFEQVRYIDIHARLTALGTEPIRGMFNHKITAGLYSAICFNLAFLLLTGGKRLVVMVISLIFVLLTGSATGLGMLFLGVLFVFINDLSLKKKLSPNNYISILLIVIAFTVTVAVGMGVEVLEFLGRDPTLTGRTTLWAWGLEVGLEKPVLGWGYVGYNGTSIAGSVSDTYVEFSNYDVPHFHNSYIQLLVEGGGVMALAYIGMIFISLYSLYEDASSNNSRTRYFEASLLILLFLLTAGFFIHLLLRYNNFPTMLIISLIIYSGLDRHDSENNLYYSNRKRVNNGF